MIPAQLLNDLALRIVALNDGDLVSGRDAFADDEGGDGATSEVFRALAACLDAEVARRERRGVALVDDPALLTDLARAVTRLGDRSLNLGILVHGNAMTMPADGPAGVMACFVAILGWERRERRRTFRAFEKDATSERVSAWWGDAGAWGCDDGGQA